MVRGRGPDRASGVAHGGRRAAGRGRGGRDRPGPGGAGPAGGGGAGRGRGRAGAPGFRADRRAWRAGGVGIVRRTA
ncbi:hypothetical protein ETD86_53495 [Nonomuraea turkmeniaca]|uniref:Uncharacterized protein n=1 Tax=Nonomuraea turkmeniaca TaxID=103838 RepID=A0A5S4EUX9_9ACTN|nr:hypothetical protein ETD86_53495 [Nonomuraea turkmeniaca]